MVEFERLSTFNVHFGEICCYREIADSDSHKKERPGFAIRGAFLFIGGEQSPVCNQAAGLHLPHQDNL